MNYLERSNVGRSDKRSGSTQPSTLREEFLPAWMSPVTQSLLLSGVSTLDTGQQHLPMHTPSQPLLHAPPPAPCKSGQELAACRLEEDKHRLVTEVQTAATWTIILSDGGPCSDIGCKHQESRLHCASF